MISLIQKVIKDIFVVDLENLVFSIIENLKCFLSCYLNLLKITFFQALCCSVQLFLDHSLLIYMIDSQILTAYACICYLKLGSYIPIFLKF